MSSEFKVVGICGKAFAGKTTSADYLTENYGFEKTAYAKLLKETAMNLYPWMTDEQIYGSMKEVVDTKLGITPRRMLQLLGTEIGRLIWKDTWIDSVKREISDTEGYGFFFGMVVDDVRFPNEVDAIKEIGGQIWVIKRPESGTSVGEGHESEAHAEAFEEVADHILDNDADFDSLHSQIDSILKI